MSMHDLHAPDNAMLSRQVDAWRERIRSTTFGQYHHHMGVALLGEGSTEAAAAAFHRALEVQPDHHRAAMALVSTLRALGRETDADALHRSLAAANPDYMVQARIDEAIDRLDLGLDGARGEIDKACAMVPGHLLAEGYRRYLDALGSNGASLDATTPVDTAGNLSPDLGNRWLALAHLTLGRGDVARSAATAGEAVRWLSGATPPDTVPGLVETLDAIASNNPPASMSMRWMAALLRIVVLGDSPSIIGQSALTGPEVLGALEGAARYLVTHGRIADGLALIGHAPRLDKEPAVGECRVNQVALACGDIATAMATTERAVAALTSATPAPVVLAVRLQHAVNLLLRARFPEAQEQLSRLAADFPEEAAIGHHLALADVAIGQAERGERTIRHALTGQSTAPHLLHSGLALILLVQRDVAGAINACDNALAFAPDDPAAASLRALGLLAGGKTEEALGAARTRLAALPQDPYARCGVTLALDALGRQDEAVATMAATPADGRLSMSLALHILTPWSERLRDLQAKAGGAA